MKNLYILSGLPGSGKSTYVKQRTSQMDEGTFKVVSADLNRLTIGGSYDNFEHEEEVWNKVYSDIAEYAKDDKIDLVLVDNTSISNKSRMRYAKFAKDYRLTLLIFKVDKEECLRRNAGREKKVPEEVIERMARYWQEPNDEVKRNFNIFYVERI